VTTVQLTLPDGLAQEAQTAGLLTPQALEAMVRESLRKQRVNELFDAMERMHAAEAPPMTEDEIQAEIDAARAERRARRT
jgi:hypothetical protein